MVTIPRLVVSAPASGHGKTTVATGLMAALAARGLAVSPHKVGPDYIDPSYHGLAAGRPGRNLDAHLVGAERIPALFQHGWRTPQPADVAVVEGVMGLFDGARVSPTGEPDFASTAHIARLLDAPVVLVVDTTGMAASIAALATGYAGFDPRLRFGGVILNKVGSAVHESLLRRALNARGIRVFGAIPREASLEVPSAQLGLVTAIDDDPGSRRRVEAIGGAVAAHVDLDALLELAGLAPDLPEAAAVIGPAVPVTSRIAVAGGAAFHTGYPEHAELLAAAGAEVAVFDPIRDKHLPDGTDGLVIGCGAVVEHLAELSANTSLRREIAALAAAGAPVMAECAGLVYLSRGYDGTDLCGVLGARTAAGSRSVLGYRTATAAADSLLFRTGDRLRGHEFHRAVCLPDSSAAGDVIPAWQWETDTAAVTDGFIAGPHRNVHASFLHTHWAGAPDIPARIVTAARLFRETRGGV